MTSAVDRRTDVVVVGGGPVGLACAVEARAAGLDVVVVEPREGVVDKACGEGLMPGTLAALHRLGVDPAGHPIAGIRYVQGARRADHRFRSGPGRGVRRTVLHEALLERATQVGVRWVHRRVDDVAQDDDGVTVAGVRASWLLACDGLHSTVRRLVGLDPPRGPRPARRRYGLRRHVVVPPWTDLVEVHWSPRVEAYVTPVSDELVGIALLGPQGDGFDAGLASLPDLARRVAGARWDGPVRGAGPLRQTVPRRTAGRVRLVGDASGYVDALTGEGLRVGLAQARAAVATLEDPRAYEVAWYRCTRDYRLLTSSLVAWATSPLRGAVVPTAQRVPALYGHVVERLAR